ncbi:MAG TPA: sugar transferase [Candidatus Limnocylindrales bacterium]|nr:sugar transferase [Candidatus Limnocylindrales bacterium]
MGGTRTAVGPSRPSEALPARGAEDSLAGERGGRPAPIALPTPRAPAHSRGKRLLDVVGAVALLVLSAPIWLSVVPLIKLTSPGPALFRQVRLGLGGRPFTCLKFRTMYDGVSDDVHREYVLAQLALEGSPVAYQGAYKLVGDRRVTPVGRFLRRTSLDELPQLLNVLRGEMSLVGPRPPLPYEVARYDERQIGRLAVRPGITGLWQVSGRNRLTYAQMIELDLEYIERWSIATDLAIALRTPLVMLTNSGRAA